MPGDGQEYDDAISYKEEFSVPSATHGDEDTDAMADVSTEFHYEKPVPQFPEQGIQYELSISQEPEYEIPVCHELEPTFAAPQQQEPAEDICQELAAVEDPIYEVPISHAPPPEVPIIVHGSDEEETVHEEHGVSESHVTQFEHVAQEYQYQYRQTETVETEYQFSVSHSGQTGAEVLESGTVEPQYEIPVTHEFVTDEATRAFEDEPADDQDVPEIDEKGHMEEAAVDYDAEEQLYEEVMPPSVPPKMAEQQDEELEIVSPLVEGECNKSPIEDYGELLNSTSHSLLHCCSI